MKKDLFKLIILIVSFVCSHEGTAQDRYIKLGATVPGTSVAGLVGNGACVSFGKVSKKVFDVRSRVGVDLFFHKGSQDSFVGFNKYPGMFGGDMIQSTSYQSTLFLNGQLVASLDYFLFDNMPNFFIGPDVFLSAGLHNYRYTLEYVLDGSIYTSGGGVKAHVGFEKPLGAKNIFFGEYAIGYVVTTPYFLIEQPSYTGQAERPTYWFTVSHQFSVGFRF
ncbi:MAG: hypothetical protein RLZZ38_1253 [Bacteroidota bacterium]|jgi:hypothetical protein